MASEDVLTYTASDRDRTAVYLCRNIVYVWECPDCGTENETLAEDLSNRSNVLIAMPFPAAVGNCMGLHM